jgi:type I restriction enzyme R subunit
MDIKPKQMVAQNKTRGSFLARIQDVIDNYNLGSISIEEAYEELIKQAEDLSEEESRAAKSGMSEEEQELFDLLKKDKLSQKEEKEVKLAAHTLLEKVMDSKNRIFLPEWHKEKASQEKVKHEIQEILNETLPQFYDRDIFTKKTDIIFQHFFELAVSGRMAS